MKKIEEQIGLPLFSRGDSAIRCFGFLIAVRDGADVVVTLDDDCRPENEMRDLFVARHLENLRCTPAFASSVPGIHVRGLPYRVAGRYVKVGVSMGLWSNRADMDSIHMIMNAPGSEIGFRPPRGVRVMSPDQLFPFCGMNFAFTADMLPALYFPKMGKDVPFSRFDDIWAGLVLQKAAASVGRRITVGDPVVDHRKASKPFSNLRREAPCMEMNEWLWTELQDVEFANMQTLSSAVTLIADWLLSACHRSPDPEYMMTWSAYLKAWVVLCSQPG